MLNWNDRGVPILDENFCQQPIAFDYGHQGSILGGLSYMSGVVRNLRFGQVCIHQSNVGRLIGKVFMYEERVGRKDLRQLTTQHKADIAVPAFVENKFVTET